jgi:hypothetical protein
VLVLASVEIQKPMLIWGGIPQRRFGPGTGGHYGEGGIF